MTTTQSVSDYSCWEGHATNDWNVKRYEWIYVGVQMVRGLCYVANDEQQESVDKKL